MATAASAWYTDLDFDSYVLDILLFGWCAGAAMVYVCVNAVKNALGPVIKQPLGERQRDYAQTADNALASLLARSPHGETCHWFNNAVGWLYLHYYNKPRYLEDWIKALNIQLTKLGEASDVELAEAEQGSQVRVMGPVQNKVESIQHGSLPPKFIHISCECNPDNSIVMHARIESQDLFLAIFASQHTSEGVRLTNCIAHVLKLNGTLRLKALCEKKDVVLKIEFESHPAVKVEVKPVNPYQDPSTLVDLAVVEQNVRNALALATTSIPITQLLMPGDLSTIPGACPDEEPPPARSGEVRVRASDAGWGMSSHDIALLNQRFTAQNLQNQMAQLASTIQQPAHSQTAPVVQQVPPQSRPQPMHSVSVQKGNDTAPPPHSISVQSNQPDPAIVQQKSSRLMSQPSPPQIQQRQSPGRAGESLFEPISPSQYQSAFKSPSAGVPLKPPQMVGDRRLYVKVVKGNSLTLPGKGSVNAVCYISTDEPIQSYTSSVVRSTSNPFWDEHFLFDITQATKELRFEVYDKGNQERGEEYIGESTIYIEDLTKTPSSRQILRLQSQPGSFDYTTGTITAEFLFMEPAEADSLLSSMTPNVSQLSPRRKIEVSQTVTPGGMRVTTTTTTTQKPQYSRMVPAYNTALNYVEKYETDGLQAEQDTSVPRRVKTPVEVTVINGAESVADAAIRELKERSRRPRTPTKTSTLIITGVKREAAVPVIKTIESSPTEESPESAVSSQASPERQGRGVTPESDKKKAPFWKRFGRKKRSYSADRSASSSREGAYLKPPEPHYGTQSKDDLELVRPQEPTSPNLKKSRSLGGSLKKLFRRGRKSRSRAREGEASRESSVSRGSGRNPASRDGSLNRQTESNRASSVS